MKVLVDPGNPGAFQSLTEAITYDSGGQPLAIDLMPGQYRTGAWQIRVPLTIRALHGHGSVTITCSQEYFLLCEEDVTLDGLSVKGWGTSEPLIRVSAHQLSIVNCTLDVSQQAAVQAWDGAAVKVRGSVLKKGGLYLQDCRGHVIDSTIGEPSEVGISLWGAAKGLVQRTAIRNGQKNGVRVTAGSQLRIEDSLVEAVGHEYPAIMVDDRSHAIIARTQVRGGNSSITVDESEVALDSADLADASYCGIMLTKATLTTAATSRIGSAAYGLQHDGASVFPDQGLAFDDVTHGSHLKQTLTVTGESTEYLYTWRDADAREWNQVDTYDSDGTLTGTRVVEPAKTAEQRAAELQPLLDELDALVGLQSVKKQVRLVIDTVRFNQLRQSQGLPPVPATTNLVFLGNPGTGKTTVARLYGRILAALGAIRTGQVVEASRTDLVGRYLGETAQKTTQKIEEALGGVLFIDEAYALSRVMGAHSDFGIEAIDTLVLALENRRDDLVVIVAGYTFEMDGFLQTNPGLASRFGARILFEDYSLDDMVEILRRDVSKSEFTISDEALAILREQMASQHERLASGNAREVRKLVEAMQRAQASRIMRASLDGTPTREQLRELLPSDADEWMQGD